MKYQKITEGIFHARPNRFIAEVTVDGERQHVHVKNTGRCRELLIPGCRVYLEKSDNPGRKTPFDLVAAETPWGIVNMDAQIPNAAAYEWLRNQFPDAVIRREVKRGNSRVDLTMEREGRLTWVEV
ncbi:MAG: DNA/RNA nuclease SfsA, partial [Clostridia bacterium]|nr:DNA/RNA nuclease SfsA [Clostridia bacterium]